jgi:arylsulfatase A-like enzyme
LILNGPRAGFPIWSAFDCPEGTKRLEVPMLAELTDASKTVWGSVILDTFVGFASKHAVKTMKPRAMYISYGETDDWAHEGAYERYLKGAQQFDRFIGELWALVQSMPEYRDSTTFIITTDHGRGPAPVAWKNHGANIADSAYMWFAIIGPDTKPLGERSDTELVTQSQVAATVSGLLGLDFVAATKVAAPPIQAVISR